MNSSGQDVVAFQISLDLAKQGSLSCCFYVLLERVLSLMERCLECLQPTNQLLGQLKFEHKTTYTQWTAAETNMSFCHDLMDGEDSRHPSTSTMCTFGGGLGQHRRVSTTKDFDKPLLTDDRPRPGFNTEVFFCAI